MAFATRGWMAFALICNLLGGIFLFFSFQIEPSHFKLVRGSDKQASICVDGRAVMISNGGQYTMGGGIPCPGWDNAKPTAEIHVEKPAFVYLGFLLTIVGFLLQCISLPKHSVELVSTGENVKPSQGTADNTASGKITSTAP
ncbi:MAG: hypothetical protein LAO22_16780 [Acidobacteriia bacterium]|nr:hypothetical protein [Terriglobia bacterium]